MSLHLLAATERARADRKRCQDPLCSVLGHRQEEAAGMERPQIRDKVADLSRTKTNRPRAVPLNDLAVGTLESTPIHIGTKHVFWHQRGKEVCRHRNVSSRFGHITRRLFKEKKISRRFPFHDLRHWFAVDYLRAGGNIYDLQKVMGHKSIKTTELYLDFLTPEEAHAAKFGVAQKGHTYDGSDTKTVAENAH